MLDIQIMRLAGLGVSCHSITYCLFTGMINTEYPERVQVSADTVCKMDINAALTGVWNAPNVFFL